MDAASLVRAVLDTSGLTKASLSAKAGVSRALLDSYLAGKTQPSVAQVERLAQAAGLSIDVTVSRRPEPHQGLGGHRGTTRSGAGDPAEAARWVEDFVGADDPRLSRLAEAVQATG